MSLLATLPPYLARPGPALYRLVSPSSDGFPGNRAAAGVGAVSISTQVSISLDTVNQSTVGVGMAELQRDS